MPGRHLDRAMPILSSAPNSEATNAGDAYRSGDRAPVVRPQFRGDQCLAGAVLMPSAPVVRPQF